jgi:F-type H+-transporting ATPase subunit b
VEALGINLPGLLAQIVNFGLLLFLLGALLYRPVLRVLDERARRIQESMEQAEQIRRQAQQAEEEFRARMEEARREARSIVDQALQAGRALQEEARAEAQRQAAAELERARSQIQAERDAAIAELRREFADLAIRAAERVIRRSLDRTAHRQLVEEVLEESGPSLRS